MFYWYVSTALEWHVLDHDNQIKVYNSGVALRKDYPNAEYCPPSVQ